VRPNTAAKGYCISTVHDVRNSTGHAAVGCQVTSFSLLKMLQVLIIASQALQQGPVI
jgi:hypothetical protein